MFGRKKRGKDAQADSGAVAETEPQDAPEEAEAASSPDPRALGP